MNAANIPSVWKDIVQQFTSLPCNKSIWSITRKLLLANIVYHIWKERNDRMFNNGKKCEEVVIQSIIEKVRL